jgi:hypothetical protein
MSEPGWVPLLTLDHEDGTAAVFRDADGRHWLSSASHGGTGLEGYEPALEGLEGDAVVVGGLMPPGATEALFRDSRGEMRTAVAGGGAWLAYIDDHDMFAETAALFRDAEGAVVRRPPPAGARSEPIPDANVDCPACGASEWERIAWTHRWEEEDLDEERSELRCVRCGHGTEEGAVSIAGIEVEGDGEPVDEPRIPPEWLERQERAARDTFERAAFPIYGLGAGWEGPRMWGGSSWDSQGIKTVSLCHGDLNARGPRIDVETVAPDEDWRTSRDLCLDALSSKLMDGPGQQLSTESSTAAISLSFTARHREVSERAARAQSATVEIRVDGAALPFYAVSEGDVWAACGAVEGARVVVSAVGVGRDEVELATVTDPGPYL